MQPLHVTLFYILCAFFLEKGNNSRNKCKSAIYRNRPRQIC